MKKLILIHLMGILFLSCKDEYTICDLPTAVRMKCVFYHFNNGILSEAAVPFLIVRKISSPDPDYALPMLPGFSLALNPLTNSVQYQVSIENGSTPDTLTFVYNSQQITVSPVCGEVYINNLSGISSTSNTLDSVRISNGAVTTTPVENVRIYF